MIERCHIVMKWKFLNREIKIPFTFSSFRRLNSHYNRKGKINKNKFEIGLQNFIHVSLIEFLFLTITSDEKFLKLSNKLIMLLNFGSLNLIKF